MDIKIVKSPVEGRVTPPCSKSYAQRAIAAALLARGRSVIGNIELCQDTQSALRVSQNLGARVEQLDKHTFAIEGGLDPRTDTIDIGESGLSTRLFTPIASLCSTPITITGRGSILRRPVSMMMEPLRSLGVKVRDGGGYLPIQVEGPMRGGEAEVDGTVSSQFLTGLLMAAPLASGDTQLCVPQLNSTPYIAMTLDLAARFGVDIEHRDWREFYIPGGQEYRPMRYDVEGDWSGASCMLVAGAVAGRVTLSNLNPLSLQADVAIIGALSHAGAEITSTADSVTVARRELHAFEFDATHCPDLFPALAALAANCEGVSTIRGTSRLLHKESNRAEAIYEEWGKMGVEVDIDEPDVMRIRGTREIAGAEIDSHNDHRIAMAAAVTALNCRGEVTVCGAECVDKSYPDFWRDLDKIRR